MPSITKASTGSLTVELFWHGAEDPEIEVECWRLPCIAFTRCGTWRIRSARGAAALRTDVLLVAEGNAEYVCEHPNGIDDRVIAITYRDSIELGEHVSARIGAQIQRLQRALMREISTKQPEPEAIDDIGQALAAIVIEGGEHSVKVSPRIRRLLADLRACATANCASPEFDFAAAATSCGFSRTRFVHAFSDAFGITPHQYLIACRVTQASQLLRRTSMPVIEVCFASGFGSLPRFHAAFSAAFGLPPEAYRKLSVVRPAYAKPALFERIRGSRTRSVEQDDTARSQMDQPGLGDGPRQLSAHLGGGDHIVGR